MNYDFQRLKLLCERAACLPPLPASVFRLMEITEGDDASAGQIAAITSADPMLTTKLLRAANGDFDFAGLARITSVQAAVLRLGMGAVRSMAISLGVQAMFTSRLAGCLFDPVCFARHSILVGLLGRYVFVRCKMRGEVSTKMKPDDVFAAGVLHDLPVALLAWVAPEAYDQVHIHCKDQNIAIERGFEDVFGGSIRELGTRAIRTWGLPESFELTTRWVDDPLMAPSDNIPIMSIYFASATADTNIAESNGFASAPWSCPVEIDPAIQEAINLDPEEVSEAFSAVLNQIEFYLPSKLMTSSLYLKGRRIG